MIAEPYPAAFGRGRVRVLVYSPDETLTAQALTALGAQGIPALAVHDQASMLRSLSTDNVRVAVIDARGSSGRAARLVAPIRAQHPRVRVILVDAPHGVPGDGALVIERSRVADALPRAVRDAYLNGRGLREPDASSPDVEAGDFVYLDLR